MNKIFVIKNVKNKKPNNYMEAVKLLDSMLSLKQKDQVLDYTECEVGASMYFTLGLWIKDHWLMDEACPLGQQILSKNPSDLDKYIHLIIKFFHRYLNGKPLNLVSEAQKIDTME